MSDNISITGQTILIPKAEASSYMVSVNLPEVDEAEALANHVKGNCPGQIEEDLADSLLKVCSVIRKIALHIH